MICIFLEHMSMKQRDYRIDNLRALAILSVVLGHSIILYSPEWQIYQTTQSSALFSQIKHFINLYQMPLFFSLSGYLFAGQKNLPFIEFLSKKTKRLLFYGRFVLYAAYQTDPGLPTISG